MGGRPIGRTPDSGSGYPGSSPGLPANNAPNLPVKAVLFYNPPLIGATSKANSPAACHRLVVPAGHRSQIQRSLAYATSCRNQYYRAVWRCERRLWRPPRLFPDSTDAPVSTLLLPQQQTAPGSQTIPGAAVSNTRSSNPAANPAPLPPEFHQACV